MVKLYKATRNKRGGIRLTKRSKALRAKRRNRLYSNIQGTLIPDRTCVKLKYARDIKMTLNGTGGMTNLLYRCNSIYDPQQATSTDDYPLGYKEYERFYKKYMVIGSKITVTWKSLNQDSNTNPQDRGATVGMTTIADTSGLIVDKNEFMCNNRANYKNVCIQKPYTSITKKFNPKRFFGINKMLDNQQYGADFGANPKEEAFWQLACWNPSADGTSTTLWVNVMISYVCVLRERQNIGL